MRYDTEEAFFRATFFHSQTAPCEISNLLDLGKAVPDMKRAIAGEAVKLMRGAFTAHLRADASPTPGDSLLSYRLNRASEELPDEWKIVVTVVKGEVTVDLYNPVDEPQALPDTDDLSSAVLVATRLATGEQAAVAQP
jgi:hypothetical protein